MDESTRREDQQTLSPLPSVYHHGLISLTFFGFLSFILSVCLFLILAFKLALWRRKGKGSNQFVILIFNLVLADIQQSMAFLLNAQWLIRNEITVGSATCWAQGWFVSTGDLSSGVFCLAIGVHTFASAISNYRLPMPMFIGAIIACWVFVYFISAIGVFMHPDDIFVRAGAWCWISSSHPGIRLWTHYFFIFAAEFGTLIIYAVMYFMLHQRIRSQSFSAAEAKQAKQAAQLMVVYPLVYVICTVPLASVRMASMSGRSPSIEILCFAGSMITSNGWLDVVLYTVTRRIMLFSDSPPEDNLGLATFHIPFRGKSRFGNTTTIEATLGAKKSCVLREVAGLNRQDSMDELVGLRGVSAKTTVEIRSDPVEAADIRELERIYPQRRPVTPKTRESFDSKPSEGDGDYYRSY